MTMASCSMFQKNVKTEAQLPSDRTTITNGQQKSQPYRSQALERGELSASAARTIAVAENQEELAHKIINEKLPVAEVANIVKQGPRTTKSRAYVSKTIDDDTRRDIENRLKSVLGVAAKLVERRGGAGQITLSFSNRIQMQELIDKLTQ